MLYAVMEIASNMRSPIRRHPGRWGLALLVVAVLATFALYWFAPWNLFVDREVDEALPGAVPGGRDEAEGTTGAANATGPAGATGAPPAEAEVEVVALAEGGFESLEHETEGTALVIELEDGSRFLRLEDLVTSNGPDLRVILSDQPLSDDWEVWDDGNHIDLGGLKGNLGSSNYAIPSNVALGDFETAVIWCRRFSVGFGVAPLTPAP